MFAALVALMLVTTPQSTEDQEQPEPKNSERTEEQAQPKKICRYIRMEMGSRRKEKVCLTKEEWVDFNQGN